MQPVTTNVPCLPAEPVIIKPTMKEMRDEATRFLAAKQADILASAAPATPVVAPVTTETEAAKEADKTSAETSAKPKRARKPKNSVSLETAGPEPEVVVSTTINHVDNTIAHEKPLPAPDPLAVLAAQAANCAVPVTPILPAGGTLEFAGKPTAEQMADYRKKVSVFTSQLPSSENLGSVQKMRAFITKMSGTAPQYMTTEQWEEQLSWFESFVERNQIKGLVKYINETLNVS
jgi:hypothetical protein